MHIRHDKCIQTFKYGIKYMIKHLIVNIHLKSNPN